MSGAPPPRTLARLSHLALVTPDVAAVTRFYQDVMGLRVQEQLDGGSVRLGFGAGHHVLELQPGTQRLDHFALEIPDDGERERVIAAVERHGASCTQPTVAGDHPECVSLIDPDGNRIELHGRVDRSGEGSGGALRPDRVQHLALSTRSPRTMVDFYESVLGFRVSDRMGGDAFAWLRCGHEHHTVAIVERATDPGLDHYSYDVPDWAAFKRWGDHLARHDVPLLWGPGRHGPGNNLFVMFADAGGFLVELSAEMTTYWDDRADVPCGDWEHSGRSVSLWGAWPSFRQT